MSCVQCNNGSFLPLPSSSLSFRSAKNNFGPEEKKGKGGDRDFPALLANETETAKVDFFVKERVLII